MENFICETFSLSNKLFCFFKSVSYFKILKWSTLWFLIKLVPEYLSINVESPIAPSYRMHSLEHTPIIGTCSLISSAITARC